MTDNDIIKALECCTKSQTNEDCKKLRCTFFDEDIDMCGTINSETIIQQNALDLINRQKEMIDGLIAGQETLQKALAKKNAEIESLKEALKDLKREMSYMSSPNTIGDRHEMGCW